MLHEIQLSRADLNLLVLFEAVMDARHVGRAAERLNLSASAVSHGLGRLRRLLNDPLFLRNPRGVAPTARALELAAPIADILARVRSVVASAEPFDAARSTRRFTIGAPDGVSAVVLPSLLAALRAEAPRVDVSVRQLLPSFGATTADRVWRPALDELDARAIDIAIAPTGGVPARFCERTLYEEDFVIAARRGHAFPADPSLDRYCAMDHLLVSQTGEPFGFIDEALAARGLSRRVALTVPNFMMALALIAETDLIAALPRRLVAVHAARFGLVSVESPLPPRRDPIRAIVSKTAMMDAGVAWLFGLLHRTMQEHRPRGKRGAARGAPVP